MGAGPFLCRRRAAGVRGRRGQLSTEGLKLYLNIQKYPQMGRGSHCQGTIDKERRLAVSVTEGLHPAA